MIQGQRKRNTIISSEVRKMHPYQTVLYFGMISSAVVFLTLIIMYAIQRFSESNDLLHIRVPKMFIVSTIVLMISGFIMAQARSCFIRDEVKKSLAFLFISLGLGIAFAVLQAIGWIEFYRYGYGFPNANVASSYVYIISGIHVLHVLLALAFLLYILLPAYFKSRDAVGELILVTNPFEKKKMDLMVRFWHYVDVLWLVLFFFFILTF